MNMRRILLSSLTAFTLFSCSPSAENKSETSQNDFPEEVKKLLSEMSVEEKVGQMAILNLTVLTTKDSVTGKTSLDKKKSDTVKQISELENKAKDFVSKQKSPEGLFLLAKMFKYFH